MNEQTLKTEKHIYAYIHTYKYTYINSCVQPMAYRQWDMTASSGNWWYPWTVVCGFSGVLNPIFLSVPPTLGCPAHGRAPCLACYILFQRSLPKHHPVSLVDFQGWLCVPSMHCATCSCCSPCQPAGWLLDAAALHLRCGLWDAFFLPWSPSPCTWWCWVMHFNSFW